MVVPVFCSHHFCRMWRGRNRLRAPDFIVCWVGMRGEFMRRFLLAGAAFGALIGPAVGSDMLPPRDRVPAYAWNGWYAGVTASDQKSAAR